MCGGDLHLPLGYTFVLSNSTQRPLPPPPVQGPLHFDTGYLTSNLPLGGSAHLVVDGKGDYTLSTHAHDSGFNNISYVLGVVLMSHDGQAALGIPVEGHVEGTSGALPFGTPDRNDDQTKIGNDPRITQHFDAIAAGATLIGRLDGVDKLQGGVQEAMGLALEEGMKEFGKQVALTVLKAG